MHLSIQGNCGVGESFCVLCAAPGLESSADGRPALTELMVYSERKMLRTPSQEKRETAKEG